MWMSLVGWYYYHQARDASISGHPQLQVFCFLWELHHWHRVAGCMNWNLNIVRYKFCKWQLYIGLLTRNQSASSHCMERFSNSWWDTIAWSSSSHSWGFKKKNYLAKKNDRSWFDWVQLLRTRVWIPILNPNDTLQHLYHDWRHDLDLSLLQGEAHQRTRVYFALQSLSIPALHSIHGFQQMLTIIYEFMWAEGYISSSANGSMIVMVTVCITCIRWEIQSQRHGHTITSYAYYTIPIEYVLSDDDKNPGI